MRNTFNKTYFPLEQINNKHNTNLLKFINFICVFSNNTYNFKHFKFNLF